MSLLTRSQWRALTRALGLLDLAWSRVWLAVVTGALGLGSSVALTATSAWLIARASQMPHVLDLTVAAVGVRTFGISRSVLRYAERIVSHGVALRGMAALREQVYVRLADSPVETVAGLRRGDLLVRTGADVDAIGDLVVRALLPAGIALVVGTGTVAVVAWLSPASGLILLACLLLAGTLGPLLHARAARASELAQVEERAALAATALTMVDGGADLTVSGRLADVRADLAGIEAELDRLRERAARPAALAAGLDVAAMALAVLGAILVGIPALVGGTLAPVELAVVVLTPLAAFEATSTLGAAAVQLVRSAGAAERVMALLDAAAAPDLRTEEVPETASPVLTARDLAVGWPGGPVVATGVDLTAAPGRAIAVVGPSGIGKTTLLATLAGLLPARDGAVNLAGVSVAGATRRSVARHVTMTAEDAHIFATTVLENLRVARGDLTAEEADHLLRRCGLASWLDALPQGLDTMLGADGATVSGGERRRILLARALASPAPLLLIDEPAEHLDQATAERIMNDLLDLPRREPGRGVVVVTHHLAALGAADEVVLLQPMGDGPATVWDRGTHEDLVGRNAVYAEAASEGVS